MEEKRRKKKKLLRRWHAAGANELKRSDLLDCKKLSVLFTFLSSKHAVPASFFAGTFCFRGGGIE